MDFLLAQEMSLGVIEYFLARLSVDREQLIRQPNRTHRPAQSFGTARQSINPRQRTWVGNQGVTKKGEALLQKESALYSTRVGCNYAIFRCAAVLLSPVLGVPVGSIRSK